MKKGIRTAIKAKIDQAYKTALMKIMYSQPKYKFQKWNIFVQIIEEEKMKAKNLVDNYKAKI